MGQPNNGMAMIQQNLANRAALLASAPRMRKKLGTTSGSVGGTSRVKLFNVGIITKLVLRVVANVTIGTATASASPKGPWNAISRVRLTDYDGTDRVNLSGFQLWMLNCVRSRTPYGLNNEGSAAVTTVPVQPTAVGTANIEFLIEVPLAFDAERDLRGAILAQTAVGEMYLSIDWNSSFYTNANSDSVYNGAGTTTVAVNSINVDVWQEYLMPQAIGDRGVPLPALDLLTVYELQGNLKATDNLAINQERLINLPNVRSVLGTYLTYTNNGVMTYTDTSAIRLIANGNNVLREYNLADKLHDMRGWFNGDLKPSAFVELSRDKPVETALYGNVQIGFTPAAYTAGNTHLEIGFESFYTKGATLPGLSQSAA